MNLNPKSSQIMQKTIYLVNSYLLKLVDYTLCYGVGNASKSNLNLIPIRQSKIKNIGTITKWANNKV